MMRASGERLLHGARELVPTLPVGPLALICTGQTLFSLPANSMVRRRNAGTRIATTMPYAHLPFHDMGVDRDAGTIKSREEALVAILLREETYR